MVHRFRTTQKARRAEEPGKQGTQELGTEDAWRLDGARRPKETGKTHGGEWGQCVLEEQG